MIQILIINIIPLYILIALGYIAGRKLDVNLTSLARIVIFILSPVVTFGAVAQLSLDVNYLALPFMVLGLSALITAIMYKSARARWHDHTASLIGVGSCAGNTGYFGVPLILSLYGTEWLGVYLLMNVGVQIAESSFGYFLAARGHHTIKESVMKVLKLPALHALYLGLLVNVSGIKIPELFDRYWHYATGAWIFIGMMIIGIALSKLPKLELSLRLTGWLFFAKFILWPLGGAAIILADQLVFQMFTAPLHGMILIFTTVPLMSNLVAFAAQLNLHPEKAASCVLVSTIFALIFMPAAFIVAGFWGLIPLGPR